MYRRAIRVYTLVTPLQAQLLDDLALINRRSRSGMLHVIMWDWLARAEMTDERVATVMRDYRLEEDYEWAAGLNTGKRYSPGSSKLEDLE